MDVSLAIKQRLDEMGMEQRELARFAQVTESYISQLLNRRRLPPAPNRTDIYEKMERALKLPRGELAMLAAHQRKQLLKRELGYATAPLFGEVRELILGKCHPARVRAVRAIFETTPFGELERLVTKTVLELAKRITREQLENEPWLRTVAKLTERTYQDIRVVALEFLDTDLLDLSHQNCVEFLDPLIKAWDIDLPTFEIEVALNPKVSADTIRRFQYTERASGARRAPERGFVEFLRDRSLSGSANPKELEFLESLRFTTGQPTAHYYYRELQSLRDPLHFRQSRGDAAGSANAT